MYLLSHTCRQSFPSFEFLEILIHHNFSCPLAFYFHYSLVEFGALVVSGDHQPDILPIEHSISETNTDIFSSMRMLLQEMARDGEEKEIIHNSISTLVEVEH